MSSIRDLLIRGSKKVIGHCGRARRTRKSANCTEVGSSVSGGCRTSSMAASLMGSRRDLSDGRRPLRGVRGCAEAARTHQVEMVCSCDRRACRHVRIGMQSRQREIQSGARAVSAAVRQCFQVGAETVRAYSAGVSPVQEHRNVRSLGALNARCQWGEEPEAVGRVHIPQSREERVPDFSHCRVSWPYDRQSRLFPCPLDGA